MGLKSWKQTEKWKRISCSFLITSDGYVTYIKFLSLHMNWFLDIYHFMSIRLEPIELSHSGN